MGTLKASFHFYSRNIEYLMLLSFSILLPPIVGTLDRHKRCLSLVSRDSFYLLWRYYE